MVHWLYNVIDIIIKLTILNTSLRQFKKQSSNSTDSKLSNSSYNLEYFFKLFLHIGILAIFTAPFVVSFNLFYPYTIPKALWIHTLNWILLTIYLLGMLFSNNLYKKYKPKLNFVFWMYFIYIVAYFISSFFGSNFSNSFWSDYQRMNGLYWHIHTLILFFIMSGMLNTPEKFYRFLIYIFFGGFVLALFYVLEFHSIFVFDMPGYADSSRVVFTFGNPGYAGLYFMMIYLVGLCMLRRDFMHAIYDFFTFKNLPNKLHHFIYFLCVTICLIFIIYSIMISASRSAFLGSVAGTTFFLLLLFVKSINILDKNNLKLIITIMTIFILVLVGISLFIDIEKLIFNRIENLIYVTNSNADDLGLFSRLGNLNVVYNSLLEKPLFGYGMSNFQVPYNKFSIPSHVTSFEMDHAHNVLTNILATGGIFVFSFYLYLKSNIILYSIKNSNFNFKKYDLKINNLNFIIPVFFIGYYVHHLFWFDFHESYLIVLLMMVLANYSMKPPKYLRFKKFNLFKDIGHSVLQKNKRIISAFVIIIIPLLIINIEFKIFRAANLIWEYGEYKITANYQNIEEFDKDLAKKYNKIDQAIEIFPPLANVARAYIINDGVNAIEKMPSPIDEGFSDYALSVSLDAISAQPEYWKHYARTGILYYEKAKYTGSETKREEYIIKSEEYIKKAIDIGPSRGHLYSTLVSLNLWFGNVDKANMALDKYKNFLISRNSELDHNFHIMKSLLEFHDCNNFSDDYNILNNCISKIN